MSVANLVEAFTALEAQEQKLFLETIVPYIKRQQAVTAELSPEWKVEIDRRWESIKNGTAQLLSWEEMQARINEKYGVHVDIAQ